MCLKERHLSCITFINSLLVKALGEEVGDLSINFLLQQTRLKGVLCLKRSATEGRI